MAQATALRVAGRQLGRTLGAGWFTTGALVAGAAVMWLAYHMARYSTGHAHFLVFWVGYCTVLAVTFAVGISRTTANGWRLTVLLVFGVLSYLPKFLMSFSGPVYFDEFGQWRAANDLLAHGHFGVANTYLPIERYYPGLQAVTVAVHFVTGLSTWHAGQLVVVLAHTLVLVVVWRIAHAIGLSERAAFAAAVVYALNPSYLYFDTQYGYESLGLPLAFTAVACAIRARRHHRPIGARAWSVVAFVVAAAVIPTHPVSAAVMLVLLLAVSLLIPGRTAGAVPRSARWGPWTVTVLAVAGFWLWIWLVAPTTLGYIGPHLTHGVEQAWNGVLRRSPKVTIRGSNGAQVISTKHAPFGGSGVPTYEIVCAYVTQVIVGLVLLLALVRAWRERRDRRALLLVAPFLLATIGYFLSLPLALTASGGESAHRLWGFAYLGVAVVTVWAAPEARRLVARLRSGHLLTVMLALLIVVAIGNTAAGENVLYRFPGPYEFGTDTRAHTPEVYQLARWADEHIPAGSHVVTDRDTGEIITGYTSLYVPSPSESEVYDVYRAGDRTPLTVRVFMKAHGFHYWILDTRIGTLTPQQTLFQNYSPASVDRQALLTAGGQGSFLQLVHETAHYKVFTIDEYGDAGHPTSTGATRRSGR